MGAHTTGRSTMPSEILLQGDDASYYPGDAPGDAAESMCSRCSHTGGNLDMWLNPDNG